MDPLIVYFEKVITELGLDLSDPNLTNTPERLAKMYRNDFFRSVGKPYTNHRHFPNDCGYEEIIIFDRIHFTSMCSHHFLPFSGYAWVLYIPGKQLIGASKPSRIVAHYAARPQLQEALVHEVAKELMYHYEPLGVMVVMRAIHGCMSCRGVNQYSGSGVGTSEVLGCFKAHSHLEMKGYELIKLSLMMERSL